MREIIFRGKRVDNGEFVQGDLIQIHDGRKFIINNKHGACIDDKGNFINTEAPFVCEVIPEIVGQYTGLTDSNGKKIFEGDIVKARLKPLPTFPNCYAVGKVVFENGTFKILVYKSSNKKKYKDYTGENIRAYSIENNFIDRGYLLEIIGNTHDNPELLKGGADNG